MALFWKKGRGWVFLPYEHFTICFTAYSYCLECLNVYWKHNFSVREHNSFKGLWLRNIFHDHIVKIMNDQSQHFADLIKSMYHAFSYKHKCFAFDFKFLDMHRCLWIRKSTEKLKKKSFLRICSAWIKNWTLLNLNRF